MPVNQPTILVKKADGSSVRLTMEEFKKYQAKKQMVVNKSVGANRPIVQELKKEVLAHNNENKESENLEIAKLPEKQVDLPVKIQSEALATSTPVTKIWVDEAIARHKIEDIRPKVLIPKPEVVAPAWSAEDHESPLEEPMQIKPGLPVLPVSDKGSVNLILKKLKFPIKEELWGRLDSLVVSAQKGVRSAEQVLGYAIRKENQGGLELTEKQAQELVEVLFPQKNFLERRVEKKEEIKKPDQPLSFPPLPEINSGQVLGSGRAGSVEEKKFNTNQPVPSFGGSVKPIMHDVIPSQLGRHSVGPEEELKMFSLVDFRRLAPTAIQAGKILQGKFVTVKNDSYLWYLEALGAWQISPLYQKYLQIIRDSLVNGKKITEYLQANRSLEQLKEDEFKAIVEVNQNLNM